MLEILGVSKTYGSIRALDNVSLTTQPGEIHAVLGENGAGKSTLMGVLSGFVLPDSGSVSLDGQQLALGRPFEIKQMGIEMVHQHFMLVPAFSVAENLDLYRLEKLFGRTRGPSHVNEKESRPRFQQQPSDSSETTRRPDGPGYAGEGESQQQPSGSSETIRRPDGPGYAGEGESQPGPQQQASDSKETLRRPNGPGYVSEGWSEPAEALAQAGERNPGKTSPTPLRRAEGPRYDSLQIANELGWQIDPNALARDLTVGAQQRVEILKALSGDAKVIILDEPTAVLSPSEVEDLFRILRKLKERGKIVILIAHKLREAMQIADRVTVLRKGLNVGSDLLLNVNEQKLAEWMVGGMPPLLSKQPAQAQSGLTANNLSVKGNLGQQSVRGVSFTVGKGEILGIGGVDGNGQIELAEALAQVRHFTGEMLWQGRTLTRGGRKLSSPVRIALENPKHDTREVGRETSGAAAPRGREALSEGRSPGTKAEDIQSPEGATHANRDDQHNNNSERGDNSREGDNTRVETENYSERSSPEGGENSVARGFNPWNPKAPHLQSPGPELAEGEGATQTPALGYIPQDRQVDGLALGISVQDNLLIQGHRKKELAIGPFLINKRITKWAKALVQRFSIAVTNIQDKAGSLSGGNQQKVVVARTLESEPELLIAVNPTRGLDIQATNYVHQQLLDAKQNGAAIVLFTTDLDELSQLADRTLFMSSGRFAEGVDAAAMVGGSS